MKNPIINILIVSAIILFSACEKNPIGCFNASSNNVKVGETVTFTDCSTKAKGWQLDKGTPSNYSWDFGDGQTATGSAVDHSWSSPGVYAVTLVVKDKDGDRSATISQNITVTRPSDLSRSGKFLAFTSNLDGDYDIYLAQVDANGNLATSGLVFPDNPHNLTNANAMTDKEANWSPDGRILIYSAKMPGGDENIYAFFFNSDGSLVSATPAQILAKPAAWDNNASFSPDGKYLIFDRRVDQDANGIDLADARDIMLAYCTNMTTSLNVDSVKNLTNSSNLDEGNPKWSPIISVRRVAFESPTSPTANDHDIYVMDPFNTTATKVDYNVPGSSGYPAWQPNCTAMAFESNSGNGGFYKIVSAAYPNNAGTSDIAKSSIKDYRYPTCLPNGNKLAFIEITGGLGNIYVVNWDGSGITKLLPSSFDAADNTYPAW
jgi:Tol biopolymer transport system component